MDGYEGGSIATTYLVSGLSVVADLRLPGMIEAPPSCDPAIRLRRGRCAGELGDAIERGPTWQLGEDAFLLEIPGIVRMELRRGEELRYEALDGTTDADLAVFVGGTGLGILLQQRGHVVLHASAVRVGEAAVLFCGPSGAGKSTLAAALAKRGHDLVADDFSAVAVAGAGPAVVSADGRELKLWDDAIERLALTARRGEAVRRQLRKFHVDPLAVGAGALPVAAVYVLAEDRPPAKAGIVHANIAQAAALLRAQAYRPMLVRRMRQDALYLSAAAAIVRHGGVFTLTRPRRFDAMDEVLDDLAAHWRALGLTTG